MSRTLFLDDSKMDEITITKFYRFFKRILKKFRISSDAVSCVVSRFFIEPVIFILARVKKMKLFVHENWGTRVRYLLGWYEYGTVLMCKKLLRPGMTALDIGADIGYYARLFSTRVGYQGKVFAFEPHPESFRLLQENVSNKKYANVSCINNALSDKNADLILHATNVPGKHSLFYVIQRHDSSVFYDVSIKVKGVTLDEFLQEKGNPPIDLIKMDIEGAEPRALTGMQCTLTRNKNIVLIVEFNGRALKASQTTPQQFLRQIQNLGFSVLAISEETGALVKPDEKIYNYIKQGYVNLLCTKGFFTKKVNRGMYD